jgi:hypothetical protein
VWLKDPMWKEGTTDKNVSRLISFEPKSDLYNMLGRRTLDVKLISR